MFFEEGERMPSNRLFEILYLLLERKHSDSRKLWDLNEVKRWGSGKATEGQLRLIQQQCKNFNCAGLTKGQASQIINRLSANWRKGA